MSLSGRSGKGEDPKPDMYAAGKSDDCVVLKKPTNEAGRAAEELVEGRRSAKGIVRGRPRSGHRAGNVRRIEPRACDRWEHLYANTRGRSRVR